MELGLFTMPSHPPERALREGWEWDLQTIVWADQLGFKEAWIGEHHTAKWEPHPAPDLLTIEALRSKSIHYFSQAPTRNTSHRRWLCWQLIKHNRNT